MKKFFRKQHNDNNRHNTNFTRTTKLESTKDWCHFPGDSRNEHHFSASPQKQCHVTRNLQWTNSSARYFRLSSNKKPPATSSVEALDHSVSCSCTISIEDVAIHSLTFSSNSMTSSAADSFHLLLKSYFTGEMSFSLFQPFISFGWLRSALPLPAKHLHLPQWQEQICGANGIKHWGSKPAKRQPS